jgi:predicted TIM-barrel fold metal-dependent hydrolase
VTAPGQTLEPDPRLRAPKRALPKGAVDCHAHIFDRPDRYGFSKDLKYSPPVCPREDWLALHKALGVERGVQVHGSPYGFDNSITEDFLKVHHGRFVGIAAVSPSWTKKDIEKLDLAGFRGARLMDQFATAATTADLEPIAKLIAPFGWHIEINIAKSADWLALEPRLRKCPVPIVFDHLGRVRGSEGVDSPAFKLILKFLTERDDCWTKVSSWYRLSDSGHPDHADMKPLVQKVLAERPDRCVWGTNWPHPGLLDFMPNDADLVDQLDSWLPSDQVRDPLFASNAKRLYRLQV